MIKRVIFDIDNTLIEWKSEYDDEIEKSLKKFKIPYTNNDLKNIFDAMEKYESTYYTYKRNQILDFINTYTKKNYPMKLLNDVLYRWSLCVPKKIDDNIIETLEYLNKKYEMVILTDWFGKEQENRLKLLSISKYFSKVFAAENVKRKPFKEAFLTAIEKNKPEECMMIGDNFERDVQGALNAGLKAIYFDSNNKSSIENENGYYIISNLVELKNIL